MSAEEVERLEAELVRLRGSLRFRTADLLAEAASSPKGLAALPAGALNLWREARSVRAWRRVVLALECGLPNDPFRTAPVPRLADIKGAMRAVRDGRTTEGAVGARIAELQQLEEQSGLLSSAAEPLPRRPGPVAYVVHAGLPDTTNGYAQRTHALAVALRAQGEDVIVFLRGGTPGEVTKIDGVPYRRIGEVASSSAYTQTAIAYGDLIERQLRRVGAGLVHAASNHLTGQAAGLAARSLGLPFVYEVRGLWEVTRLATEPTYEGMVGFRTQRALEIGTAKAADRVLVNGEALVRLLREAGVGEGRIELAPNGCDLNGSLPTEIERAAGRRRFGLPNGPIIGFVGSMTAYEGLDILLEAAAPLFRTRKELGLLMVGDGTERPTLESSVRRRGLADRAIFTGSVSREEAQDALRTIDIAPIVRTDTAVGRLVPPLKPLEAMANGAALILTDLPPLAPMAAHGRAQLVQPSDVEALQSALETLIDDNDARRDQIAVAQSWVREERSWAAIAQCIIAVYSAVSS